MQVDGGIDVLRIRRRSQGRRMQSGGSICRFFSGAECTDDASCKKKPCCKSWARNAKANLESLCTGVSEKMLKEIDDEVSPCLGL
jgi:hypothetical protein